MGLAGALLVFTGVWHVFEWLMGGRNKDTLMLIPFGIVYIVLGYLIVTFTGGSTVAIVALLAAAIGLTAAMVTRKKSQVRSWVMWVFIVIDVVIIGSLAMVLLS